MEGITADNWYGLFAPAGTPPERIAYLAQAVGQAMKSPAVIAKIHSGGNWAVGSQPAAFKTRLQEDTAYWADMVKTAGVSPDRRGSAACATPPGSCRPRTSRRCRRATSARWCW